jgi:hypothetical protein
MTQQGHKAQAENDRVEDLGLLVVIEVSKERTNQDRTHCDVMGAMQILSEAITRMI